MKNNSQRKDKYVTEASLKRIPKDSFGQFAHKWIMPLHTDVAILKRDVSVLKRDMKVVKSDISDMKIDMSDLKKDNRHFKKHFKRHDVEIKALQDKARLSQL